MDSIKVFAPATIGNIGPGFDVLGLAIEGLGDSIEVRKKGDEVKIIEITGDGGKLPKEADKNTAGMAVQEVLKRIGASQGVEIKLHKKMPSASGLGSSAASASGAAFAVNRLFGKNKLNDYEVLIAATLAESKVSGGFFADNTAPCLYGGATLTRSYEPLDVVKLGSIDELVVVLAMPKYELLTKVARGVLPERVPLKDFVSNMANACLVASAFTQNNYALFSRCLNDKIIEPARAHLIPGFYDVKNAALKAGADGCTISGAGPAIFAITNDEGKAEKIAEAMKNAFEKNRLECSTKVTRCCNKGVQEIE